MFFCFKTKKIFFFLIMILNIKVCGQLIEHGVPFIQNFHPKSYGFENQNFSIAQDSLGFFYFSNISGVLQFDGKNWNLIKVPSYAYVQNDEKGNIYARTIYELGKIDKDGKNNYYFKTLFNAYKYNYRIIDFAIYKKEILLLLDNNFVLSYNNGKITIIDTTKEYKKFFKIGNNILLYKKGKGLFLYKQKLFREWYNDFIIQNKEPEIILPHKNVFLIKFFNEKELYFLDLQEGLIRFINDFEDFIEENEFSYGITLENNFLIGTKKGGLIGINENGKIFLHLSTDNYLIDDCINYLFIDKWNNLWAALNNGVSRIEINSSFTWFSTADGIKGIINDIKRFDDIIFCASTLGLFYLNKDFNLLYPKNKLFLNFKDFDFACNKLFVYKDKLYVTSEKGLFVIDKNFNVKKLSEEFCYPILHIGNDSFLVGFNSGCHLVVDEKLFPIKNNISFLARTLAKENNNVFWIGTDFYGVFRIKIDFVNNELIHFKNYKSKYGFPTNVTWIDVYNTSLGVLFSTIKGIYKFDSLKNTFYKDTLIVKKPEQWVYPIVQEDNYIWYSINDTKKNLKHLEILYKGKNNIYEKIYTPFLKMKNYSIESIYIDKDAIAWFGSYGMLFRFDAKKVVQDTLKPSLQIKKIFAGSIELELDKIDVKLNYKENNLKIEVVSPYYTEELPPVYRFYLKGFDKKWSAFQNLNFKEYTNLPPGKYVIYVQARNYFGVLSDIKSFSFTIITPLYMSTFSIFLYFFFLLFLILTIIQWRSYVNAKEKFEIEIELNERTKELAEQKEKVEMLIRNILPEETITEYSERGKIGTKKFKMVTILFSDVKGFTELTSRIDTEEVFAELNKIFEEFDKFCEQYYVEKIKTIGDAYMCAGGIPVKNSTNAIDVTLVALKMIDYIKNNKGNLKYNWQLRIGLHTGEVLAGVVGKKKFAYDIWGDAVNIASRLEATSEPNEINISQTTYELINEFFICEPRGKIPIKYKGFMDMYFVKGIKPIYSEKDDPYTPNEFFLLKIQHILFKDLEELIITHLDKGLPSNLYYHNVRHTIDIVTQVEILGIGEEISLEELLLLKTAALFHDYGFIYTYDDHEEVSVRYAREILPKYRYKPHQIEKICELILSTKANNTPKNKLEMILNDADLDYLGREDYIPLSYNLFRELHERGRIKSYDEWIKLQYDFLLNHKYYTETAKKIRESKKIQNLKNF